MEDQMQQAERMFRETQRCHRRVMEHSLDKTGVFHGQHMTLMFLAMHEGCAQKQIAEAQHVSMAAVTGNLKKLEKAGLVDRHTDSNDNRRNVITITDKGREVVKQSQIIFETVDDLMMKGLSDDEMNAFIAVGKKILENLRKMELNDQLVEHAVAERKND